MFFGKYKMFEHVNIGKPLRDRKKLISLLLETIRLILIDIHSEDYNVVINIENMNRVFYITECKITSYNFPFKIDKKLRKIYLDNYDIEIDNRFLSAIISIHNKVNSSTNYLELLEALIDVEKEYEVIDSYDCWVVLRRLYEFDLGYFRYDFDEKHQNGKLHPLNHLDINLEEQAAFKIGLYEEYTIEKLVKLLDKKCDCLYLS